MTAGIEFDPAERDAIAAEMNISVLKRTDTAIKCVLKSANHVCLYKLQDNHQWRRLEVEGSLFIVERHIDHRNNPDRCMHRIVIINRKSLNNYTDDIIVGNKHLELADQMIMYSNSKGATIGIWFYQKDQADDIFDFLQRIVRGEKPQPVPEPSRPKRSPKRPSKPVEQSAKPSGKPASVTESGPQNSLERFFPNLKLTNGVAGHQVPDSAKDTMLESQAVSTMNKSPEMPKAATAFKPTSEIDAAIIVASEIGIPEEAGTGSTTTDAGTLASQALQMVQGRPKSNQKQKTGARPRSSPTSTSPQNSNRGLNSRQPYKPNGVGKTTSPPRGTPSMKGSVPGKGATGAQGNPVSKQPKQILKASPYVKRVPVGKRGQVSKVTNAGKPQAENRSSLTSARTSTTTASSAGKGVSATHAVPNPQIQLLQRPKSAAAPKLSDVKKQHASDSAPARDIRASRNTAAATAVSSKHAGDVNMNRKESQAIMMPGRPDGPSTPNAPDEKKVPWAPLPGGGDAERSSSSNAIPTAEEGTSAAKSQSMKGAGTEDDVRRQLHNFSLQQAHAEKLKIQEAHMLAMQQGFPFVSGDLGMVPPPSMLGGGMAGPGTSGSGFAPSLHPQMAMMMHQHQHQHQMFMRQQFLAQQRQRQMQSQAEHVKNLANARGAWTGKEIEGIGVEGGQTKTKEESANDLMRMLNVDRGASQRDLATRRDENQGARSVGDSIANAEKVGELGTSGEKLDKMSFRAVVQRMLTDRKLFDSVYDHYLYSRGE